jgi:hypothetical protein
MPFDATGRMAAAIPFAFDDYLELVDTTQYRPAGSDHGKPRIISRRRQKIGANSALDTGFFGSKTGRQGPTCRLWSAGACSRFAAVDAHATRKDFVHAWRSSR